jgi:hypothetical protein
VPSPSPSPEAASPSPSPSPELSEEVSTASVEDAEDAESPSPSPSPAAKAGPSPSPATLAKKLDIAVASGAVPSTSLATRLTSLIASGDLPGSGESPAAAAGAPVTSSESATLTTSTPLLAKVLTLIKDEIVPSSTAAAEIKESEIARAFKGDKEAASTAQQASAETKKAAKIGARRMML